MSSTKEMYEQLTKAHGISKELCKYCFNRDVEVYQCDFEGCYECWMTECEPKISLYPSDDDIITRV